MSEWVEDFERVTFGQSLGLLHAAEVTRVVFHETQGWCAQHAFNVYAAAEKGACPNITAEYAGTNGRDENRYVKRLGFQHVPFTLASYALERGDANHVCMVATNRAGCIQIERVGFVTDRVSDDELVWFGEVVLAPILMACPKIPLSVFQGFDRMEEAEWSQWTGGLCRHINVPCQPQGHTDGRSMDLDVVLEHALRYIDKLKTTEVEPEMILLRVINDPAYPCQPDPAHPGQYLGAGVQLEVNSNGMVWVQSGVCEPIYLAGGVKKVDVTLDHVTALLKHKPGIGAPPSTVGSAVDW